MTGNSKLIKYSRTFLTFGFLFFTFSLRAQDIDAHSPKPSHGGSSQQQVADKKKQKQQAEIAKGNEEGRKLHDKIQAKNTKAMMKKSKKSSQRWNDKKKEPFFKRLFRKKGH